MFKIIGADQKEYGPVTADQINAWILEGRANGQTLVQAIGSSEWKPLSGLAEFATALGVRSSAGGPPSLMESKDPSALASAVLAKNVRIEIGQCLSHGWRSLLKNPGLFIGAAGLLVVMRLTLGLIPFVGGIANWILYGALYGGFYLIFLKRLRDQPTGLGELFAGFSQNFSQLMLVGIVSQLLIGIGMIVCVIPGIYLAVAWRFSVPLVMDKGLDFWPAMEASTLKGETRRITAEDLSEVLTPLAVERFRTLTDDEIGRCLHKSKVGLGQVCACIGRYNGMH